MKTHQLSKTRAKQQNWKGVALILTNIDVLRKNKNKNSKSKLLTYSVTQRESIRHQEMTSPNHICVLHYQSSTHLKI